MEEETQISSEKKMAVLILRENREEVLRRWLEKISLLARDKNIQQLLEQPPLRDDAREFLDLLISRLEGKGGEAEMMAFHQLILEGRSHRVRLADITYLLVELKSVGKQVIFERIQDELEAFRVSRALADAIEGMLRKGAELYELTAEVDYQAAETRLREVFAAWDLEAAVADAETPGEVCRIAGEILCEAWGLVACRWRLYPPGDQTPRDLLSGEAMPVPVVREKTQYLTDAEAEAGGAVSVLERTRRRRESFFSRDVAEDTRVVDAPELIDAGVRRLACLPLEARQEVIGVLLALGGPDSKLAAEHMRKLKGQAAVVAFALDRAGHLEWSHRRLSEAEVIARIGRSLLELPTREALLEGVVEALRDFRDYFDVALFWVDRQAGECVLMAEEGRERSYSNKGYRQKVGEGFIGVCAENGETIRSTDLENDPRRLVAFDEEYRARSELVVPVKRGDEVIGVMHLLSDREDDFPESEIVALENVAPHIGVALQNVRMIDQRAQDRYEIERVHRQISNIIRHTAVGITSADPRGVYTHWSPSCEAMLGYSADEVVDQKTAADFAAEPYDLEGVLQECLRQGRLSREGEWLRTDGTTRVIRETRVPMEDEHGEHIGFTSYLVDATEQKRAQEQLRRERDMLQLVVDAMGAGLALFDRNLKLRWANSTLMQWFELGPDAVGKKCHEIYLCGRKEDVCPAMQAALEGRPQTRVHEFVDPAGAWHCYNQVFTPLGQGETRLIVLTQDITDQRRQTEEMRLISRLTEKVETSLDMDRVLHLVLTSVTAGHAIGFNRAFVLMLDEEGECLEGKMAVGPVSSEDARRIWESLDQMEQSIEDLMEMPEPAASDRELTEKLRSIRIPVGWSENPLVQTLHRRTTAHVGDARSDPHLHSDLAGKLELQEFVCVPLAAQDEPLGVLLADNRYSRASMDRSQVELLEMFARQASLAITNARAYERIRDQLDELRRTRDKLIEAERMASVGRMAGHLAHEIRNPLTTIGGFAASIARKHPDDSVTHRNADIIYKEVRRLERTLVNVLDYTRPLRPDKTSVDINQIVQQTLDQFTEQFEENNIELHTYLDENLPNIQADGQMMKQVVLNLVKNAIEAMEGREEGALTVETSQHEGYVLIHVIDTGGGLTEEARENLFSPFFTTKVAGVGLGLSVSQRIVRQHGGELEVENRPGRGTHFTVSLAVGNSAKKGGADNGDDTIG